MKAARVFAYEFITGVSLRYRFYLRRLVPDVNLPVPVRPDRQQRRPEIFFKYVAQIAAVDRFKPDDSEITDKDVVQAENVLRRDGRHERSVFSRNNVLDKVLRQILYVVAAIRPVDDAEAGDGRKLVGAEIHLVFLGSLVRPRAAHLHRPRRYKFVPAAYADGQTFASEEALYFLIWTWYEYFMRKPVRNFVVKSCRIFNILRSKPAKFSFFDLRRAVRAVTSDKYLERVVLFE